MLAQTVTAPNSSSTAGAASPPPDPRRSSVRWQICALLFFVTTINYIDRQIIGVLKPDLSKELGWSEMDYANIITAFQVAYAVGFMGMGRLFDRVGVRAGFGWAVSVWSLAAMAHGLVRSVAGFGFMRFGLGLAEGGNFPGAIKAVGEWFPKRERALATGIFNAGSNVGALITPLAVPWIAVQYGWPMAFYATGALGFLWLVAWRLLYCSPEQHPRVSSAELAYIRSDPPDPPVQIPWLTLLRHRQTWAFALAMFLVAPVWWFYLFWIPGFLHDRHGLDLISLGPPLVTIYLMTDVGSIAGGWLSSRLIARGWSLNAARKTALLACALCVVPVLSTARIENLWMATLVIGLAASAHQGFAANLFTLVSDTVPRQAVSSVVGIGGTAGAIGGMCIAQLTGYLLERTHNYAIPFFIAAFAYLAALLVIHLLLPRLEPMTVHATASEGDLP